MRGFSLSDSPKNKKTVRPDDKVNYGAGADILHHFQLQWNELHELAEENAAKARNVDILIGGIYERLDRQWGSINILNGTLAAIPKINNDIQNLMDQIGNSLVYSFHSFKDIKNSRLNLHVISRRVTF